MKCVSHGDEKLQHREYSKINKQKPQHSFHPLSTVLSCMAAFQKVSCKTPFPESFAVGVLDVFGVQPIRIGLYEI